jgi:Acetyltransferase (isoleucine patch superfamily)
MSKIGELYRTCRKFRTSFVCALLSTLYYRVRGKHIVAHTKVTIRGLKNIKIAPGGSLWAGTFFGFSHKKDVTLLNIEGELQVNHAAFARGSRIDIGEKGLIVIGDNTSINPFTRLLIQHKLVIGSNCLISWNCQILDEDFHTIDYPDKKNGQSPAIIIGDHVWIGSNTSIYKGVEIGDGCVIAANSVVKTSFPGNNLLIAGNPARVVKENVTWH